LEDDKEVLRLKKQVNDIFGLFLIYASRGTNPLDVKDKLIKKNKYNKDIVDAVFENKEFVDKYNETVSKFPNFDKKVLLPEVKEIIKEKVDVNGK
jgi:hypothetical protein